MDHIIGDLNSLVNVNLFNYNFIFRGRSQRDRCKTHEFLVYTITDSLTCVVNPVEVVVTFKTTSRDTGNDDEDDSVTGDW